VRDVLRYLQQVLGQADTAGRVLEIGGTDVITYREMMRIYAEEAGLRARLIIPVPVLSPHLSSLWVGLVTPLPRSLARPLVDSLVNEVVVHDHLVEQLCPGPRASFREAVRSALGRVRAGTVVTSWSVAEPSWREHAAPRPTDPDWSGGSVFLDERTATVAAPAQAVYDAVSRVGGERGWYSGRWLWGVRGALDKLVGGPGMRRARRQPDRLSVGDPLDFWRVDALEPGRLVRLRAEMRLPGEAWLEWRIESGEAPDRESRLHQIATFVPRGLWGRLYWYGALPFHRFVFPGLLHGLAEAAEAEAGE
jgi:hypothetical protein